MGHNFQRVERMKDVACFNDACSNCDARNGTCLLHIEMCRSRKTEQPTNN